MERPEPTEDAPQHLCLDKGYDNMTGAQAALDAEYVPHIHRIGEEKRDDAGEKTHPARRWVVERTLAWLSPFARVARAVRQVSRVLSRHGQVRLCLTLVPPIL